MNTLEAPPIRVLSRDVPKLARNIANGQAYAAWKIGGRRQCRYFGPLDAEKVASEYAKFRREWIAEHMLPTDARPGTPEKIAVLSARNDAGLPLYHRGDTR